MKLVGILITIAAVLLLNGCRFYYEEKPQKDSSFPTDLSTLSYQTVHEKVFAPRCISCHGNSGGVNLESYASVRQNLGTIEKAALVNKTMPKSGSLSSGEAALLSAWIKAGAPEYAPGPIPSPTPEEPLKPYFNSIKKKIIDRRCIVCHSAGGAASGVPFTSLKSMLDSPREIIIPKNPDESGLIIAVERTDNKRMPPPENANPLSQDEISVLRKWIEDGAPENETSGPSQSHPTPKPEPLTSTYISIKKNVFERRCISCHAPGEKAAGVPLFPLKDLLNSPRELVLPGNPDESGLWIAITRQDNKRMPPPENADPLKANEIETVRKWIEIGAPEK